MLSFDYELIHDPYRIWKSIDRFENLKLFAFRLALPVFWPGHDFEGRGCLVFAAFPVFITALWKCACWKNAWTHILNGIRVREGSNWIQVCWVPVGEGWAQQPHLLYWPPLPIFVVEAGATSLPSVGGEPWGCVMWPLIQHGQSSVFSKTAPKILY